MTKAFLDALAGVLPVPKKVRLVVFLSLVLLLIRIIQSILQKISTYAQTVHEEILNQKLTLRTMGIAMKLDLEYYDEDKYYDKLNNCVSDSYVFGLLLWNAINLIGSIVTCLIVFVALTKESLIYSMIMLIAAVPSAVVNVHYTRAVYRLALEQSNGERQKIYLMGIAMDRRAAQDIRLFDAAEFICRKYEKIWKKVFDRKKRLVRKKSTITGILESFPEIVMVGIMLHITIQIIYGQNTLGDYSLYSGLLIQFSSGILAFSNAASQIYDNKLKIVNYRSLEEYPNQVEDKGTACLERVREIEFYQVSFSYPGTKTKVLEDVSFKLHEGEKVALVGVNGCGKSTLIKLLLRFYDVDSGSIKINGRNIQEYSLKELRRNFSIYFQDAINYSFSLRENFIFSDSKRSEDYAEIDCDIKRALSESDGIEILDKAGGDLNRQLTRFFAEDGVELSGGQHQRIAIARAFYRRHTALILDEPSSNLDPEAEYKLFEKLREFTKGKTTLFTSHRLSNISLADRIVVLEHGKIVEDGTQRELLENPKRYAQLYQYQKEKFQTSYDEK